MGVKRYKPTTAGRRISSVDDFADVTKSSPQKKLTIKKKDALAREGAIVVLKS